MLLSVLNKNIVQFAMVTPNNIPYAIHYNDDKGIMCWLRYGKVKLQTRTLACKTIVHEMNPFRNQTSFT